MTPYRLVLSLAVFTAWTVASYLCHQLAKMALESVVSDVTTVTVMALAVTVFQVLLCCVCFETTRAAHHLSVVIFLSHCLATLATNTSLALTFASSALAIKMLEPVSSAVMQRLMFGTALKTESLVGMVAVVVGAVAYVGNPAESSTEARAVVMAVISNLTLGVRNVAIKYAREDCSWGVKFRSGSRLVIVFTSAAVLLSCFAYSSWAQSPSFFSNRSLHFVALSLTSGVFHVTYTYVSTCLVLQYMSVLGHALVNILKRVLVVCLLHVSGQRSASWLNWGGLALCTAGLLLYNKGKMTSLQRPGSEDPGMSRGHAEKSAPCVPSQAGNRAKGKLLTYLLASLVLVYTVSAFPWKIPTAQSSDKSDSILRTVSAQTDVFAKVLLANTSRKENSATDYLRNLRFGYETWTDGQPLLTGPVQFQPERKSATQIQEFMSRSNLISTPFDTDGLSPYLETTQLVIDEAKRIHFNIFTDLFKGKKYAMLFEVASHENKGDSAITVSEFQLLENMNIELLFYLDAKQCKEENYLYARDIASKIPKEELVILLHGGGNIFGYAFADQCRERSLRIFSDYQIILLSQSIFMRSSKSHFDFALKLYCCNPRLTILLRDRLSLQIAQRLFNNGTRLLLVPDMVFQLGHISRFTPPFYDVIWQRRTDREGPGYAMKSLLMFAPNVSLWIWDWGSLKSMHGDSPLQRAINILQNGLGILQKGRVVVTDRLHGHILSTLLDIPHVLLDNHDNKLSSYHNTWTRGLLNCRLTDNVEDAARLALELLEEYRDTLPKRLKAADIAQHINIRHFAAEKEEV